MIQYALSHKKYVQDKSCTCILIIYSTTKNNTFKWKHLKVQRWKKNHWRFKRWKWPSKHQLDSRLAVQKLTRAKVEIKIFWENKRSRAARSMGETWLSWLVIRKITKLLRKCGPEKEGYKIISQSTWHKNQDYSATWKLQWGVNLRPARWFSG